MSSPLYSFISLYVYIFPLNICLLLDLNSIALACNPSKSSAVKYFNLGLPSHLFPNARFKISFDNSNNINLVYEGIYTMTSGQKSKLRSDIVKALTNMKSEVIGRTGMKEISYAINKHNDYAGQAGINYTFNFSVESDLAWYETMDGIGMIAIIQGISLGNRYLNYKAYSKGVELEDKAYLTKNLYHISNKCNVYLEYANSTEEKAVPSFYSKKADAATQGYYPCPICKP